MTEKKLSPERVKEIIDLQSEAARKDIPCMVFADREHMREALANMSIGAAIKAGLFYFVPEQRFVI